MQANADSDVDNPPASAAFWRRARLVVPRRKQPITIRLDPDVLVWFRLQKGYQTRINAILRTYMDAHRKPFAARRRPPLAAE